MYVDVEYSEIEFPCDCSAFRDRTVDVKEFKTEQSDVRYFLHIIKTRSVEDIAKMESQSLSSSLADVQKNRQLPLVPSPPISTSSTQNGFKGLYSLLTRRYDYGGVVAQW